MKIRTSFVSNSSSSSYIVLMNNDKENYKKHLDQFLNDTQIEDYAPDLIDIPKDEIKGKAGIVIDKIIDDKGISEEDCKYIGVSYEYFSLVREYLYYLDLIIGDIEMGPGDYTIVNILNKTNKETIKKIVENL